MDKKKIVIHNNKSQKLNSYLIKNSSNRLIIFCHGIKPFDQIPGWDKVYMLYYSFGNSICYFDFTGQGASEGKNTFSIEQQVADINSVISMFHKDYSEIILYGVSLGALATSIAASRNKHIAKLVLVNGLFYLDRYLNISLYFRIKLALFLNPKLKKEFAFYKMYFHPEAIKVPTYIIYGDQDAIINPEQSKHIFTELTCEKQIITVKKGDHPLMREEYKKYLQKLYNWLS